MGKQACRRSFRQWPHMKELERLGKPETSQQRCASPSWDDLLLRLIASSGTSSALAGAQATCVIALELVGVHEPYGLKGNDEGAIGHEVVGRANLRPCRLSDGGTGRWF